MYYLRGILLLTTTYLAITTNFHLNNIIMGIIIAGIIMFILRPDVKATDSRHFLKALWGIVRYIGSLTIDLIVSGIQVAQIVLFNKPINQGIIAIPSDCESDLGRALSVHAITVTPGEMVIEVGEDGTMYTHCLDVTDSAQYVIAAQKKREEMLAKIFV